MASPQISLNQVKKGSEFSLESFPDELKTQLLRLGFCVGDKVKCIAKIPKGPVVLLKGLQEVAIGEALAKEILVSLS